MWAFRHSDGIIEVTTGASGDSLSISVHKDPDSPIHSSEPTASFLRCFHSEFLFPACSKSSMCVGEEVFLLQILCFFVFQIRHLRVISAFLNYEFQESILTSLSLSSSPPFLFPSSFLFLCAFSLDIYSTKRDTGYAVPIRKKKWVKW